MFPKDVKISQRSELSVVTDDLISEWYASERVDQTGVPETASLAASIPSGSCVLDVGCGNGTPITRTLLRAGHLVIGLDSSIEMLKRFL